MKLTCLRSTASWWQVAAAWICLCWCVSAGLAQQSGKSTSTRLARVLRGSSPASVDDLKALQERIHVVTQQIMPCTVAIQVGHANGSGVIVNAEGHVLTAAHVVGVPHSQATILLPDGTTARGVTLGLNQQLDAGLIRITDPGPWPYAPLGQSAKLKPGQWCLATGHPGGFEQKRLPVLRFGRILKAEETALLTDCTLVGGDSGGPLFDLQGRVIGIHSRIGKNLTINVHVPVDPYRDSWDRLVRGEVWGLLAGENKGWLGVTEDAKSNQARILKVLPDSPAQQAGLKPGDVIQRLADAEIDSFSRLQEEVRRYLPGETVKLQVRRGKTIQKLKVQLGRRPEADG